MSKPGKYEKDYIVVWRGANIPNQKFWNTKTKDWTSDLEMATVYSTFADGLRAQWFDVPDEKLTAGLTLCNKTLYRLMLTGQWDGYGKLPDGY